LQLAETMLALAMEFTKINRRGARAFPRRRARALQAGPRVEWFAWLGVGLPPLPETLPRPSKLHSVPDTVSVPTPRGHDR